MRAQFLAQPRDVHVERALAAFFLGIEHVFDSRTLAFSDQLSGAALETRLGLPFETLQPLIEEFQKTQLMDTLGFSNEPAVEGRPIPVRMNYTVSSAGRQPCRRPCVPACWMRCSTSRTDARYSSSLPRSV